MELKDKINPKHTALVVIDIQKDFASPDGLLAKRGRDLSMVEPMIDGLEKIISMATTANVPVFYSQLIFDRTKLNELQKEQYDLDGKLATCAIDTDGYRFYRLNPPAENVFIKYDYNIFSNSEFKKTLEKDGIKTLIIAGMDTCWCVETAIRSAFDLGYKVVVPKDLVACGGRHQDWHDRTLELVKKTFGVVTNFKEIKTIWQA